MTYTEFRWDEPGQTGPDTHRKSVYVCGEADWSHAAPDGGPRWLARCLWTQGPQLSVSLQWPMGPRVATSEHSEVRLRV
jgi:hypothetical protein